MHRWLLFILVIFSFCRVQQKDILLQEKFNSKTQPFAFIIPEIKPVSKVPGFGMTAKDCGQCHSEIYNEWSKSTHSKALSDIQFQAELKKQGSPKWLCLNCHIPLQNQRKYRVTHLRNSNVLTPKLVKNNNYNENLRSEGVTCVVCHVIKDKKTKQSIIVGVYGSKYAPHPVVKRPDLLTQTCVRCHDPKGEAITPNLVCWFDTNQEMLANSEKQTCANCHLPKIIRRLVPAFTYLPHRKTGLHYFQGSGLPKRYKYYKDNIHKNFQSQLSLTFKVKLTAKKVILNIKASNTSVGHYLPTGDPERHILIRAYMKSKRTNKESQIKTYRIGQTWLWNPARKVADNRLKNLESRNIQFLFNLENDSQISIEALHVRLTSKIMSFAINTIKPNMQTKIDKQIQNMASLYPAARYIYKANYDMKRKKITIFSTKQLTDLSYNEKFKKLQERAY